MQGRSVMPKGVEQTQDTSSRDYLLDCLARWICDRPSLDARRESLRKLREKHGAEFVADLRSRVEREWKARSANAQGGNPGRSLHQSADL